MNVKKIETILYEDGTGVFARLRDRDYSISQEEKDEIIYFSKYCNSKLKEGSLETNVALIVFDILYLLPQYNEEEWTWLLAQEVMENIEKDD